LGLGRRAVELPVVGTAQQRATSVLSIVVQCAIASDSEASMTNQIPQQKPGAPFDGVPETPQRCCEAHPDLKTLRDHLSAQFSTVTIVRIDDEIAQAYEACSWFGLSPDELLSTVEIAVRHNLMLFTGQVPDSSRLDPETHVRQPGSA
jgi:hypothetical protein